MTSLALAASWSLQILLIGLAAQACAPLLGRAHPRVRARFWFAALLLSLASPWLMTLGPARASVGESTVFVMTGAAVAWTVSAVAPSWQSVMVALWAAGALVRLVRLGRGVHRLSTITRQARAVTIADYPDLRVRETPWIASPAASFLGRVILIPATFHALPASWRRAALAHERIHLDRGHGVLLLMEEVVLALFWFHPVVFAIVRRVRDSREEMVDAETVGATLDSRDYRDMLVGLAARITLLAPAVSGTTALSSRIESLKNLEGNPMPKTSKPRMIAVSAALLSAAALASATAPMGVAGTAPTPNEEKQKGASGTSRKLISRVSPVYPEDLKARKVEGLVQIVVVVDATGAVKSATARPEDQPDFAKAAIDAIRQWRWEAGEGSIQFTHAFNFRTSAENEKK